MKKKDAVWASINTISCWQRWQTLPWGGKLISEIPPETLFSGLIIFIFSRSPSSDLITLLEVMLTAFSTSIRSVQWAMKKSGARQVVVTLSPLLIRMVTHCEPNLHTLLQEVTRIERHREGSPDVELPCLWQSSSSSSALAKTCLTGTRCQSC